jgi:NAD(P)H-dependent flavin oxidoreductase YrpB (nitropropane dioxygenase family)
VGDAAHQVAEPPIIQGGMGIGVSSWRLASAVARRGHLGVVSGTALDTVLARRLQDGDAGGQVRHALAAFPVPALAERVLGRYYRRDGRAGRPYRLVPKLTLGQTPAKQLLTIVGNFVEVWLAKQGHDGVIGVNYLERIQLATPAAALGAMLAGVDYVLMGAGIPRQLPALLSSLAEGRPAGVDVEVIGARRPYRVEVDPKAALGVAPTLSRPRFVAVVSHAVLAAYLARNELTRPDGFVVEGHTAGGHNAPPRGRPVLGRTGEPVYSARDAADLAAVRELGLPFWLAGGCGTPERLAEACAAGARGVQAGTVFALSEESALAPELRAGLRTAAAAGDLQIRTEPHASPTGFPFKVATLAGTLSADEVYQARPRLCDLGYLRTPVLDANGAIDYRCSAEPVADYVRKGGDAADAVGRRCLCNALVADIGLGQDRRDGYHEPPLATLGSDHEGVRRLAAIHPNGWTASAVIDWLTCDRGR